MTTEPRLSLVMTSIKLHWGKQWHFCFIKRFFKKMFILKLAVLIIYSWHRRHTTS